MRVYRLNPKHDYDDCSHPADMIYIMCGLEDMGEVLVSAKTIESLYYEFSDKCGCGWRIVDEESISEFAEWLDEYELSIGMTLKEAVEKQIPKKPHEGHYEQGDEKPYIKYSCPNKCRVELYPVTKENYAYQHDYCPKCGQKLDWSEA